jgi:hypothetical protein
MKQMKPAMKKTNACIPGIGKHITTTPVTRRPEKRVNALLQKKPNTDCSTPISQPHTEFIIWANSHTNKFADMSMDMSNLNIYVNHYC